MLDEAIAADRAASDATSSQGPHHVACLSNLALSLTLRHEHQADLRVLDAALGYARAAVAAACQDTPDRYLSLLGQGNPSDLREAGSRRADPRRRHRAGPTRGDSRTA